MEEDAEEQVDQPDDEYHSPDEAIAAFRQLSNEEQRNLVASARACLAGSGFATPNELISEAYVRIAEGRRKWRTSKTFIQFLKGVVRSLASDGDFLPEERKLVRRNKGSAIVTSEQLDTITIEEDDDALTEKIRNEQVLSALEARFSGDEQMELLMMGIRDSLIGKDLQEAIGVDATRLEALRTRFNRELKKQAAVFGAKEGQS
ncbi:MULTISPECIES: transposase [Agrobacterium]|uniref:transposase n=1 Tax=Agrobacterium TaxID=357 RepID=UPI002301DA9C|nr:MULTISPECIES: transposase [Agrobacterium]MDA5641315.1 transposase [Agrobacterium sp. ST15.13.013]MDA7001495.1 transposase [Agrobacterium salinitolerans]